MQRARAARQQDDADQAEIADQETADDLVQRGLLGRRADLLRREIVRPPLLGLSLSATTSRPPW